MPGLCGGLECFVIRQTMRRIFALTSTPCNLSNTLPCTDGKRRTVLAAHAQIGRGNWISGFPRSGNYVRVTEKGVSFFNWTPLQLKTPLQVFMPLPELSKHLFLNLHTNTYVIILLINSLPQDTWTHLTLLLTCKSEQSQHNRQVVVYYDTKRS